MEHNIDAKLASKLQKLLNLARDGGATEGEANNAMEMAQRIARENNIDIATIEMAGGDAGEEAQRVKDNASGQGSRSWAMYRWQQELMAQIAAVNFCYVTISYTYNGRRSRPTGYNLIGRKSNVIMAKEMFTYLITTINRLLLDHNGGNAKLNMSKYSNSWKEGCADRLRERLEERHTKALEEQRREANERNAAARHPAAATGNALVVVMTDFAREEEWLNRDMRFGYEPGTSKRQHEEYERATAERQRLAAEAMAKRIADATEAGATERELAAIRAGYALNLEQARLFVEKIDAPDKRTEAQRRKDEEKDRKQQERWYEQARRREARERSRLDSRGYRAGHAAGGDIGLDKQVSHNPSRKIT